MKMQEAHLHKLSDTLAKEHDCSKQPVAPDLWFIDKSGCFHFIEVKLPGDRIAEHQFVGMSILREHFSQSFIFTINLEPR
jgi:hypothetical protein